MKFLLPQVLASLEPESGGSYPTSADNAEAIGLLIAEMATLGQEKSELVILARTTLRVLQDLPLTPDSERCIQAIRETLQRVTR